MKKNDHLNLIGCKYLSIIHSKIKTIDAPDLITLNLKNTNILLTSINCPNLTNIYAGNNGVPEDEIDLSKYNNLRKIDEKINNFPAILSKTSDAALIAARAVHLKRLRIYSDNMYTINPKIISWWLKLLRPLDVKILTKTKTREYMFNHITNRTNNDTEENSLTEVEKEKSNRCSYKINEDYSVSY